MTTFYWLTCKINLQGVHHTTTGGDSPNFGVDGKHGGLMVTALDAGASGPGSSPGQGHNV